jgi:thiamine pyrophosphokinase
MTHTLVVGAAPLPGHEPFYRELLAASAHVVAADAAGEWCVALGRVPDAVVGDFDGSLPGAPERLRAAGALVEVHPVEKDSTDLEIAIAYAIGSWNDPVTLTAAFTSRIDHTLAAIGALTRAGRDASAREPGWTAYLGRDDRAVRLDLPAGTAVSVMSLEPGARVRIDGAKWPLHDAVLPPMSGIGVSNRAVGGPLTVNTTNGIVAIIVQDGECAGLY